MFPAAMKIASMHSMLSAHLFVCQWADNTAWHVSVSMIVPPGAYVRACDIWWNLKYCMVRKQRTDCGPLLLFLQCCSNRTLLLTNMIAGMLG